MLTVKGAVFLNLQATRSLFLVLGGGVVLVLAYCALEVDNFSGHISPSK
jgi:hypothetical protein